MLDELVDEDAFFAGGAEGEHTDEVGVADAAEGLHLGAEFAEALEGLGAELLDGDGGAAAEDGLVDEAEAAVSDDSVGGEVACGGDQLRHGDAVEGGVEGGALVQGGDGGGGLRVVTRSGRRRRVA